MARKKFGQFAKCEIRHDFLINKKLENQIILCRRLLNILRNKSQLHIRILGLTGILIESNQVAVDAFKSGHITSGMLILRHVQENVDQQLAIIHLPSLVKIEQIQPGHARKVNEKNRIPPWKDTYGQLSEITHLNKTFVIHKYPAIMLPGRITKLSKMWVEYYIVQLNHYLSKSLFALYLLLEPRMGGDITELGETLKYFTSTIKIDWKRVNKKVKVVFS